jgi:hypothetical protein
MYLLPINPKLVDLHLHQPRPCCPNASKSIALELGNIASLLLFALTRGGDFYVLPALSMKISGHARWVTSRLLSPYLLETAHLTL